MASEAGSPVGLGDDGRRKRAARDTRPSRVRSGPGRVRTYYRETVSELRKVIYPTRSELVTYVTVVLIFVSIMVAAVFGLDTLFGYLDVHIFG